MDNTPKKASIAEEARLVLQQLLTERDDALKLNADLMRWKEAYRSICISLGGHEEPIDDEAKRIVEGV